MEIAPVGVALMAPPLTSELNLIGAIPIGAPERNCGQIDKNLSEVGKAERPTHNTFPSGKEESLLSFLGS